MQKKLSLINLNQIVIELFLLQQHFNWLNGLNLTFQNFHGNSKQKLAVNFDSVTLSHSYHQTRNLNVNIGNSTLINYNLKFQGLDRAINSFSSGNIPTWQLNITKSTFSSAGTPFVSSIQVSNGNAVLDEMDINNANQSVPVVAILNNSYITINNSICTNNSVLEHGSAILTFQSSFVGITNCTFERNSGQNGGVIYVSQNNVLQIENSKFENNTAAHFGGVIYAENNVDVQIEDSYFSNNKAVNSGGVIYSTEKTNFVISYSIFTLNKVIVNSGGVIAMDYFNNYTIKMCDFTENSAGRQGAVIVCDGNNSLSSENNNFTSNVAELKSAVLQFWRGADVQLKHCNFVNNRAIFSRSVIAAYISVNMTIHGCLFFNNTSHMTGVLEAQDLIWIEISHSIFTENSAIETGLINIGFDSIFLVRFSSFSNNRGATLVYGDGNASIKFVNCNFYNHLLEGNPVMTMSQSKLTLQYCTFYNNTQRNNGGVIVASFESIVNVSFCNFTSNSALKGGVFYLSFSSSLLVTHSQFLDNSANDGGIAYLQDSNATFSDILVYNNTSGGYGGVATVQRSKVNIQNSNFFTNKAVYGGCFFVYDNSSIAINNSVMEKGSAREGGAIYKSGDVNVSLENCILRNNVGKYGGAIFIYNSDYLRLSGGYCRFIYESHSIRNCLQFLCNSKKQRKCTVYTFNYTMSNGNVTIHSIDNGKFYQEALDHGMILNESVSSRWLETPYASCEYTEFFLLSTKYKTPQQHNAPWSSS